MLELVLGAGCWVLVLVVLEAECRGRVLALPVQREHGQSSACVLRLRKPWGLFIAIYWTPANIRNPEAIAIMAAARLLVLLLGAAAAGAGREADASPLVCGQSVSAALPCSGMLTTLGHGRRALHSGHCHTRALLRRRRRRRRRDASPVQASCSGHGAVCRAATRTSEIGPNAPSASLSQDNRASLGVPTTHAMHPIAALPHMSEAHETPTASARPCTHCPTPASRLPGPSPATRGTYLHSETWKGDGRRHSQGQPRTTEQPLTTERVEHPRKEGLQVG